MLFFENIWVLILNKVIREQTNKISIEVDAISAHSHPEFESLKPFLRFTRNMLKKESPHTAYKNTNLNYLSNAVTITGTYTSEADAIIAGRIEGDVYVKGKLKLENPGVVTGKIVAAEIDIYGRVEGELRCEGKVILRNSAVIKADLYARTLQVEADASISGELIVSEKSNKSSLKQVSQK